MNAETLDAAFVPTLVLPVSRGGDLASRVLRAALAVHRGLGPGLEEVFYARALAVKLRDAGVTFEREVLLPVRFCGECLGKVRVHFLFEAGLAQVVAAPAISPAEVHRAQARLAASSRSFGLVLNFGAERLEARRIYRPPFMAGIGRSRSSAVSREETGPSIRGLPPATLRPELVDGSGHGSGKRETPLLIHGGG